MTNESLKQTLQAFMADVWNRGDFSKLTTYLTPQYEIRHDPGDPWEGQVLDRDTFQERVLYSRNAFPDLRYDIQEMIAEDDRVLAHWMMSGTHKGDLPQLPATGKSFTIHGMTIYYFEGEQLCGHRQAFDRMGFLQQMGILE